MNYVASGCAFPIKVFYHSPNVYCINETTVTSFNPQTGSKICFQSTRSIKNATMLPNGCILILESSPDSILLNPRSGLITRNLLSSQILPDVIEIAAAGEYIALATTSGAVLLYNLVGQEIKFIKNIYLPSGQNDLSVINLGLSFIDEKLFIHRLVSKNLENLVIIVDIMNSDRSISQETHVITGMNLAHLTMIVRIEDRVGYIAVDDDCIIYATFSTTNYRFKSSVFRIRNRSSFKPFSLIMSGPSYILNDSTCPSFLLFGSDGEVIMGIIYAETIKFWNVSSELADVQAGTYSDDSGLFFCSSLSKSAFMEMDLKGLTLSVLQYVDAFFPFCNIVNKPESSALFCLSAQRDFIFKLGEGIYMKNRLCTDPLFKGVSRVWALKNHYLDYCHFYVLCSSPFGSVLLHVQDSSASDVTSLIGIDRNAITLCAFNVPGSSFVIHATPSNITAYDFSKIDSANSEIVRSQINSSSSQSWTHICHHQLLMACFSKTSKTISFYQIKNRPRDIDVLTSYGTFDCSNLILNSEICCISVYSTPEAIFISLATDSQRLIILELNPDLTVKSQKMLACSAAVCSFHFYSGVKGLGFVYGCRDGIWSAGNFAEFSENFIQNRFGHGPISIMSFLGDSLIIYSESGAKVFSMDSENYPFSQEREVFDWKISSACEFQHRPEEPSWIAGIENDCLVMMALNRSKISSLSKRVIFNNAKIGCFDQDDSGGNWIVGHQEADNKYLLSKISETGQLLFSFDEGVDEPVQIIKHSRSNTFVVIAHSKSSSCSKIQIFSIQKDKFEIVSEFICSGLIEKAVFDKNYISYCINDELFGVEVCPNFLNFPRRASFHFRNKILDFDAVDNYVIVSTLADGLDVLRVVLDEEYFGFKHLKGDAFSRSCYACLWSVPGQEILFSDKNGLVGSVKLVPESKFLIEDKHKQLHELGISIFKHGHHFYVQTISGGIVKIDE